MTMLNNELGREPDSTFYAELALLFAQATEPEMTAGAAILGAAGEAVRSVDIDKTKAALGVTLALSGPAAVMAEATSASAATPKTPIEYTVKKNDTLFGIAKKEHEPLSEVERDNPGLASHPRTIHPGDKVIVHPPATPVSHQAKTFTYEVRKGNSVDRIGEELARDTGISVSAGDSEAFSANGHKYLMHPGDKLTLSVGSAAQETRFLEGMGVTTSHHTEKKAQASGPEAFDYVIEPNDSVDGVGARLAEANGDPLSVGYAEVFAANGHKYSMHPGDVEALRAKSPADLQKFLTNMSHFHHGYSPQPTETSHSVPDSPKPTSTHPAHPAHKRAQKAAHAATPSPATTSTQFSEHFDINSSVMGASGLTVEQMNQMLAGTGLQGLGAAMREVEVNDGISFWYTDAAAHLESANGTSDIAEQKNNLFGVGAYDNCALECAVTEPSKAESVRQWGNMVLRNYLTPGGMYYNGDTIHDIYIKYSTSHDKEAIPIAQLMNEEVAKAKELSAQWHAHNQQPHAKKAPLSAEMQERRAEYRHNLETKKIVNGFLTFKADPHQENQAYAQAIQAEKNAGLYVPFDGEDCAALVGVVMRQVDPNFPDYGSWLQSAYAKEHPELYEVFELTNLDQLQRGDLLYVNKGSGEGSKGHIMGYVGPQADGTDAVAASGGDKWPRGTNAMVVDSLGRGNYNVIRLRVQP